MIQLLKPFEVDRNGIDILILRSDEFNIEVNRKTQTITKLETPPDPTY
jgi:hypothetical protein